MWWVIKPHICSKCVSSCWILKDCIHARVCLCAQVCVLMCVCVCVCPCPPICWVIKSHILSICVSPSSCMHLCLCVCVLRGGLCVMVFPQCKLVVWLKRPLSVEQPQTMRNPSQAHLWMGEKASPPRCVTPGGGRSGFSSYVLSQLSPLSLCMASSLRWSILMWVVPPSFLNPPGLWFDRTCSKTTLSGEHRESVSEFSLCGRGLVWSALRVLCVRPSGGEGLMHAECCVSLSSATLSQKSVSSRHRYF